MENAGLSICEEFQRARRSLIALAEKEEWLSRGTLSREPQWVDASPPPPLGGPAESNPVRGLIEPSGCSADVTFVGLSQLSQRGTGPDGRDFL